MSVILRFRSAFESQRAWRVNAALPFVAALTDGGADCTNAGPVGTYRWAVTGTTLTLTAIHKGCPDRGAVWEGTWTRTT
jgi:hypothetical protein